MAKKSLMDTKDAALAREMGRKIRDFRERLADHLGRNKITQEEFGVMFNAGTKRMITSYEKGKVMPPANLLYNILRAGYSVDDIFVGSEADMLVHFQTNSGVIQRNLERVVDHAGNYATQSDKTRARGSRVVAINGIPETQGPQKVPTHHRTDEKRRSGHARKSGAKGRKR